MRDRNAWHQRAACRGRYDVDWIEPSPDEDAICRQICSDCPVRMECLGAAVLVGEPWGIWGGLDADERRQLAHAYGLVIPRVLPAHGTNSRYAKHGCRCLLCRSAHADYERRRRLQQQCTRAGRTTDTNQSTA
jgi:hypothetical protein